MLAFSPDSDSNDDIFLIEANAVGCDSMQKDVPCQISIYNTSFSC